MSSKSNRRPLDILCDMLIKNLLSVIEETVELRPLKYMIEKGVDLGEEFKHIFKAIEGKNGRYWKVCRDIIYLILEECYVEKRKLNKILPYNPSTICRARQRMMAQQVIIERCGRITFNPVKFPLFSLHVSIRHLQKNLHDSAKEEKKSFSTFA